MEQQNQEQQETELTQAELIARAFALVDKLDAEVRREQELKLVDPTLTEVL